MKWAYVLGFLISGSPLYAQTEAPERERVELRFREWFVRMDGSIRDKGHQGAGTWLDVDEDLGINGTRPSPIIEIGIDVPSVGTFTLAYSGVHYKGDEVLTRDVLYSDQAFSSGTPTETEFWLKSYGIDYEYPLLEVPLGDQRFDLGVGVGVRLFSGHVEFRTPTGEISSQLHRPLLLPAVHGGLDITPWLRSDLRLGGMAYSTTKAAASYLETSIEVVARPWRGLYLGLGYQFVMNEITAKQGSANYNFDLDVNFAGFYLALGYNF